MHKFGNFALFWNNLQFWFAFATLFSTPFNKLMNFNIWNLIISSEFKLLKSPYSQTFCHFLYTLRHFLWYSSIHKLSANLNYPWRYFPLLFLFHVRQFFALAAFIFCWLIKVCLYLLSFSRENEQKTFSCAQVKANRVFHLLFFSVLIRRDDFMSRISWTQYRWNFCYLRK